MLPHMPALSRIETAAGTTSQLEGTGEALCVQPIAKAAEGGHGITNLTHAQYLVPRLAAAARTRYTAADQDLACGDMSASPRVQKFGGLVHHCHHPWSYGNACLMLISPASQIQSSELHRLVRRAGNLVAPGSGAVRPSCTTTPHGMAEQAHGPGHMPSPSWYFCRAGVVLCCLLLQSVL